MRRITERLRNWFARPKLRKYKTYHQYRKEREQSKIDRALERKVRNSILRRHKRALLTSKLRKEQERIAQPDERDDCYLHAHARRRRRALISS